jgi:hypothetical protein
VGAQYLTLQIKKLDEEKSKHASLAQRNGFWLRTLSLLRLAERRSQA